MLKLSGNGLKALFVGAAMVAGVGLTAGTASALPNCTPQCDFHINPNAIPGSSVVAPSAFNPTPNDFIGQDITGNYSEHLTLNSNGTFSAFGYIQFTGILAGTGNDCLGCTPGSGATTAFTNIGQPGGYILYATFNATGTFQVTPGNTNIILTTNNVTTSGLNADLFDGVTTNTYNAAAATVTVVGTDTQLFTTSYISGTGTSTLQTNPLIGAFDLTLSPTLTAAGEQYFTQPRPFFVKLDLSGQFIPTGFDPSFSGGSSQTFTFQNVSADLTFTAVPEPATLSLLGLGLVGIARRRARKQ